MKYQLNTLLAILQQAEYNLPIWQNWINTNRPENQIQKLNSLKPERWTLKLKFIKWSTTILSLLLAQTKAVEISVKILKPFESFLTWVLVRLASAKLRRYQKSGLSVVGIAGSYGKTSVKHVTKHILAHQWSVLMSPASYNTPLGLAVTILRHLNKSHQIFIAELGEYKTNDIADFLKWVQPDYAILTPIGYAHGERFGSDEKLNLTFKPLLTSRFKPKFLLVDEANREVIKDFNLTNNHRSAEMSYYGSAENNAYSLKIASSNFDGSNGLLNTPQIKNLSVSTRLLSSHQLINTLPGIALTEQLGGQSLTSALSIRYAPDVPRRLAVISSPNGSVVIDNSYNSNPGSWQAALNFIKQAKPDNLIVITAGFVELEPNLNASAHVQLAKDLMAVASQIGIIESRYNQDLIPVIKEGNVPFVIGSSQAEVISKLSQLESKSPRSGANSAKKSINYFWLEGGSRELYQ